MSKGIIYVMTTAVSGLIKIGKTGIDNFPERMRNLEANGYYNVAGLKRFLAVKVDDYDEKEKLLHEVFSKHRVGDSELFALDQDLIKQLLLSFDGELIYPEGVDKEATLDKVARSRAQGALFSFYRKGIKDGEDISFVLDPEISAIVCGEREVAYGGQTWKLSPLTYKIFEDMGKLNASGAYQGAAYWQYNGVKLKDLPDKY